MLGRPSRNRMRATKLVGVLHLFDQFLAPSLGEVLVAPVIQNAIVQPVLVDCREFVLQRSIEIIDNLVVTPHCLTPRVPSKRRSLPHKRRLRLTLDSSGGSGRAPLRKTLPQRPSCDETRTASAGAPPSTRLPGHDKPLSDAASSGRGPASRCQTRHRLRRSTGCPPMTPLSTTARAQTW